MISVKRNMPIVGFEFNMSILGIDLFEFEFNTLIFCVNYAMETRIDVHLNLN